LIDKILADWKKKKYEAVYWLEGEEVYYIDKLVEYAEENILNEAEKSFNLTILYGKDSDWGTVLNACRRYPMFSEKQVVIVKEAQQLKDIEKLEPYIEQPLASTILVIAYKDAKVDGRKSFAKTLKKKSNFLQFKKMYDNQLPEWTQQMVTAKGYSIKNKALLLLVESIGNDLNRMENEVEKLIINLGAKKEITEDDIEKYIGISKEYNVFELQNALALKNTSKAIQIVQYFESNPKSGPMQLILPTLYGFFSKVFLIFGQSNMDDKNVAAAIGVHPFMIKDYMQAYKLYGYTGIEKAILLLHHYNLKNIGINNSNTTDGNLLKEMVFKIIQP
jgi:DNA polymerase III subunit delta